MPKSATSVPSFPPRSRVGRSDPARDRPPAAGRPPANLGLPTGNLALLLREMSEYIELLKRDGNNLVRLTCVYLGKSRGGVSCNHRPRDYDRALYKTKPLTQPPGGRRSGGVRRRRDMRGFRHVGSCCPADRRW